MVVNLFKYLLDMNDSELKLNDIVYSLRNGKINIFNVISKITESCLNGEVYETYTVECLNEGCDTYFNINFNNDGTLVPIDNHACCHASNKLYTSKEHLIKHTKNEIKEIYNNIKDKINAYKSKIESIKKELESISNNEVIPIIGGKIYGYNNYTYTIIDIIKNFNVTILKLKCDSCRHGYSCIVYVVNKSKKNPNLYEYLSIEKDEYDYHHSGYTYYTSKRALKIAELEYKYKYLKECISNFNDDKLLLEKFILLI